MTKLGPKHHDKTAKLIEREMADDERLSVVGSSKPYRMTPATSAAYDQCRNDLVVMLSKLMDYVMRVGVRYADARGSWPHKEIAAIHKVIAADIVPDATAAEEELGLHHRFVGYTFSRDLRSALDALDKSLNEFHRRSVHTRSAAHEARERKQDAL
jgi:hypothetical protein